MTKHSRMTRKALRKYNNFVKVFNGNWDEPFNEAFIQSWGNFKPKHRSLKKILKEYNF